MLKKKENKSKTTSDSKEKPEVKKQENKAQKDTQAKNQTKDKAS